MRAIVVHVHSLAEALHLCGPGGVGEPGLDETAANELPPARGEVERQERRHLPAHTGLGHLAKIQGRQLQELVSEQVWSNSLWSDYSVDPWISPPCMDLAAWRRDEAKHPHFLGRLGAQDEKGIGLLCEVLVTHDFSVTGKILQLFG